MFNRIASLVFQLASFVIALGEFGHDAIANGIAAAFSKSSAFTPTNMRVVLLVWHFSSGRMFVLGT